MHAVKRVLISFLITCPVQAPKSKLSVCGSQKNQLVSRLGKTSLLSHNTWLLNLFLLFVITWNICRGLANVFFHHVSWEKINLRLYELGFPYSNSWNVQGWRKSGGIKCEDFPFNLTRGLCLFIGYLLYFELLSCCLNHANSFCWFFDFFHVNKK